MLKDKRIEFHAGVCWLCTIIFIATALLCFFGNWAYIEQLTMLGQGSTHRIEHFTGYELLQFKGQKANTTTYLTDYYTVAAVCNFLILIFIGIMAFAMLCGFASSRKTAFKKSLITIDICYVVCIVLTILSPLQMMSRIILLKDELGFVDYSFGFLPYVTALVCVLTYIVFKIMYKDKYGRKPGEAPRFGNKKVATDDLVETAVILPEGTEVVIESDVALDDGEEEVIIVDNATETKDSTVTE